MLGNDCESDNEIKRNPNWDRQLTYKIDEDQEVCNQNLPVEDNIVGTDNALSIWESQMKDLDGLPNDTNNDTLVDPLPTNLPVPDLRSSRKRQEIERVPDVHQQENAREATRSDHIHLNPPLRILFSGFLVLITLCALFFFAIGTIIFAPLIVMRRHLSNHRISGTGTRHTDFNTPRSDVTYPRPSTPLIEEIVCDAEELVLGSEPVIEEIDDAVVRSSCASRPKIEEL